jgi:predicted esterase
MEQEDPRNDPTIRAFLCKPPKHLSPKGLSFAEPTGGATVEVTLPYNLKTIAAESLTNINRYLPTSLHLKTFNQQRCYLIYVPTSLKNVQKGTKVPLVCLFHGTDETAWSTQLYVQENAKEKSWQELAEVKGFIIVWGQSQGIIRQYRSSEKQFFMYWWQPGTQDQLYIIDMLNDVDKYLKNNNHPCRIDEQKRYAAGFSNGGLFMSDVIIEHCDKFAAVCNYMGGLAEEQKDELMQKDLSKVKKLPLLIVTAHRDENRSPCLRAREFFEEEQHYDVEFTMLEDKKHQVYAETTPAVYEFFERKTAVIL